MPRPQRMYLCLKFLKTPILQILTNLINIRPLTPNYAHFMQPSESILRKPLNLKVFLIEQPKHTYSRKLQFIRYHYGILWILHFFEHFIFDIFEFTNLYWLSVSSTFLDFLEFLIFWFSLHLLQNSYNFSCNFLSFFSCFFLFLHVPHFFHSKPCMLKQGRSISTFIG